MRKLLIFISLLLLTASIQAQSTCTEDELNFKKNQLIHFRIPALQGQEKLQRYLQIGSPIVADFSTLYGEYEKNKGQGQAYLNQMCSILNQIAIIADDLLAGGDGLGQKTPWLKQNPASLFKLVDEFKTYCASSDACNTVKAREIQEQLESLSQLLVKGNDPAELIDEYYDSIKGFLPQKQPIEIPSS